MSRQLSSERCHNCGGREFVDAVDNHGAAYRGCARCRIVPLTSPPAAPELPHRLFEKMERLSNELCQTQAFILRALDRAGLSIVSEKDRAVLDAIAEACFYTTADGLESFDSVWSEHKAAKAELARREKP